MSKISKWILHIVGVKTERQFKSLKRRQLRLVIKAFEEFWVASNHCPNKDISGEIYVALRRLKRALSVKEWGR